MDTKNYITRIIKYVVETKQEKVLDIVLGRYMKRDEYINPDNYNEENVCKILNKYIQPTHPVFNYISKTSDKKLLLYFGNILTKEQILRSIQSTKSLVPLLYSRLLNIHELICLEEPVDILIHRYKKIIEHCKNIIQIKIYGKQIVKYRKKNSDYPHIKIYSVSNIYEINDEWLTLTKYNQIYMVCVYQIPRNIKKLINLILHSNISNNLKIRNRLCTYILRFRKFNHTFKRIIKLVIGHINNNVQNLSITKLPHGSNIIERSTTIRDYRFITYLFKLEEATFNDFNNWSYKYYDRLNDYVSFQLLHRKQEKMVTSIGMKTIYTITSAVFKHIITKNISRQILYYI
jgi:hypothetical protein